MFLANDAARLVLGLLIVLHSDGENGKTVSMAKMLMSIYGIRTSLSQLSGI